MVSPQWWVTTLADIVEKYGADSGLVPKSLGQDYITKNRLKATTYSKKHGQSE